MCIRDRLLTDQIVHAQKDSFPEAGIDLELINSYPGLATPENDHVVNFVKSLTGMNDTLKVSFGTEGGLFQARLKTPTVVCGPGSMEQGHKADEYISRDQLAKCDQMLANLIDRLEVGIE